MTNKILLKDAQMRIKKLLTASRMSFLNSSKQKERTFVYLNLQQHQINRQRSNFRGGGGGGRGSNIKKKNQFAKNNRSNSVSIKIAPSNLS